MNIKRIFSILTVAVIAVATLSSCDKEATGDAIVGFASDNIELNASRYLKIPVYVSGNTSINPIKLEVSISDAVQGSEDLDFLLTSKTLNLYKDPALDEDSVNIEILLPRLTTELEFTINITKYENAQHLGIGSTRVHVIPAEHDIQEFFGSYDVSFTSAAAGKKVSSVMTISENSINPDKWINMDGLIYSENAGGPQLVYGIVSDDFSSVSIPVGQVLIEDALAGMGDGNLYMIGCINNYQSPVSTGSLPMSYNRGKLNLGNYGFILVGGSTSVAQDNLLDACTGYSEISKIYE